MATSACGWSPTAWAGTSTARVASALARDTLVREVGKGIELVRAIQLADEEIIKHSTRRAEALPMGTTIAALRIADGGAFEVAWVGDSRVYLWSSEGLKQLSEDHSLRAGADRPGRDHQRAGAQPSASKRRHPGARRDVTDPAVAAAWKACAAS